MTIDLTARVKNFAIYMPSIQTSSASRIVGDDKSLRDVGLPNNLHANDFNFLDPNNRYWHYKWCLGTAAHFKDERKPNAITHRDPASCVLGDSGGYQIGQGTLVLVAQSLSAFLSHVSFSLSASLSRCMRWWRQSYSHCI